MNPKDDRSPMEQSRPAPADPICARCQQPKSAHIYMQTGMLFSLWICPTATFQEQV